MVVAVHVGEKKMDVEEREGKTRGTNKREEDNKAKQWGHQSREMDGRGERQRQKEGRGGGEDPGKMKRRSALEEDKGKGD